MKRVEIRSLLYFINLLMRGKWIVDYGIRIDHMELIPYESKVSNLKKSSVFWFTEIPFSLDFECP